MCEDTYEVNRNLMERRAQYKHQSQTYNQNIYGDYGGFQQHDDKSGNNQV